MANIFLKTLYLLALATWFGSIIFFSFFVAPSVFSTLSASDAAKLIRKIFAHYYLVGIICGAVGIVCVALLLRAHVFDTFPAVLSLLLLAAMAGTDIYARQSLMPRMNALRDQVCAARERGESENSPQEREWKMMHRASVQLNAAILVASVALLWLFVIGARGA
jgi:uncharacterized membrane protein